MRKLKIVEKRMDVDAVLLALAAACILATCVLFGVYLGRVYPTQTACAEMLREVSAQ